MPDADFTTFELSEARLRLKDHLRFSTQAGADGLWYLVEDTTRGVFYRVGQAEYTFMSMLNGKTTLASTLATTCSLGHAEVLTESEAIQFAQWLVESGLAHTDASSSGRRALEQKSKQASALAKQWVNPISLRFPLVNLDRSMQCVYPYFRWCFHPMIGVLLATFVAYAAICVWVDWDRLRDGTQQIFSSSNFVWLAITWLLTKLVHELAHALACKHFQGKVGNFGVLLLMFIPLPFVDVTDAWKFASKYQRMFVSAAGMLAELVLACIAAVVWYHVEPGELSLHAVNLMVTASLHTVLFNANPLMRFDGYHLLADLLEIPNLAGHGSQYVRSWFRHHLFGLPKSRFAFVGWHGQVIRVYGVLSLFWKIIVCVSLTLAAANLLNGVGLILASIAGTLWLGIPLIKLLRYLRYGSAFETPNRAQFSVIVAASLAIIVGLGLVVPAPSVIVAPAVVEYEPLVVLRAKTSGFLERVEVATNDRVRPGQLLALLRNDALEADLKETEAKLRQSEVRSAALQDMDDVAAWQSERELTQALQKRLDELTASKDKLRIVATIDGTVLARELSARIGEHIQKGQEIVALGAAGEKLAVAMASQNDVPHLETIQGNEVDLRIWGRSEIIRGRVIEVSPRADLNLPNPAFAAVNGGPLSVIAEPRDRRRGANDQEENYRLTEPRVKINVAVSTELQSPLKAGETGQVLLRARDEAIGEFIVDRLLRWLRAKIMISHGI